MAANPPPDINVDELLKTLTSHQGVKGYVIFNIEGIPLKRSEKSISAEKAVQYAALITDLWMVARKIIKAELKNQPTDTDLEIIRLRTKQYTELIVSQFGDFYIVCIQNCNPRIIEEEQSQVVQKPESAVGGKKEDNKPKENE